MVQVIGLNKEITFIKKQNKPKQDNAIFLKPYSFMAKQPRKEKKSTHALKTLQVLSTK